MHVNPYLNFSGNCAEAFKFYEKVFGAKIQMMMTHGNSPMKDQTPPDWLDKVMHVSMSVGNTTLMGSDSPPQYYSKPAGTYTCLNVDDAADAERIFNELQAGGTVVMALEETFFANRFGICRDRFDIPWMIICPKPM